MRLQGRQPELHRCAVSITLVPSSLHEQKTPTCCRFKNLRLSHNLYLRWVIKISRKERGRLGELKKISCISHQDVARHFRKLMEGRNMK